MPTLAMIDPPTPWELSLAAGDVHTLGRSVEASVRIDHVTVARIHARVSCDADGLTIEDLGSPSGTYVNDEIARGPRRLSNGDRLRIGAAMFVVGD